MLSVLALKAKTADDIATIQFGSQSPKLSSNSSNSILLANKVAAALRGVGGGGAMASLHWHMCDGEGFIFLCKGCLLLTVAR